jgi:DNA repair protein RecO (recombination protein O)
MPELFEFSFEYFKNLDQLPVEHTANFPLYFIMNSSRLLGFELRGSYSPETPHLNLHEGGFSAHPPVAPPYVSDEYTRELQHLLKIRSFGELGQVPMSGAIRFRLLDWYMEFLQQHTQHLSQLKSLAVLRAILH